MTATHTRPAYTARQEWATGLTVFGAVMLFLVGLLDILRGIMAIAEDDVFVTTPNYVFEFDLTSWGWIHLVLGVIAAIVSIGLLRTATWARVAGVAIAGLVILANFLSLPYYPVWSVVMITISGFIIWALCVVPRGSLSDLSGERTPRDV
jgi:nitrate reductase NapE component